MGVRLKDLPFPVVLMAIGTAAMLVPAVFALVRDDHHSARAFGYSALLFGMLVVMLSLAITRRAGPTRTRDQLLGLTGALVALPLLLAVPMREAAPHMGILDAWFEMMSALTTTGATLYTAPGELPDAVHLWRALVAWLGGLLFWVAALAILAPLNLGGFEVIATDQTAAGRTALRERRSGNADERLRRYAAHLGPIYAGLTLALWVGLAAAGLGPFEGAVIAMSTLSTSGITPGPWSFDTLLPEALIFVFLFFAVSRLTFRSDFVTRDRFALLRDPELRLGVTVVLSLSLFLCLRHFLGSIETEEQEDLAAALRALWGALFTSLSFLTTTGFESSDFEHARFWSGLETPGLVLVGLSLMGGGVATTAGGIKLLRIYALYKHGTREMSRLVYPDLVGGSGASGRRLRRQGAFVAWIFFMLFAVSLAAVMLLLALTGQGFEESAILAIAALSTTGPLALAAAETPIRYDDLNAAAQAVFAAAMVLGRLETLAIIALFNREFWRA